VKINLISRDNGVGLSRDVKIITDLLKTDGHEITFCEFGTKNVPQSDERADLNIFIELVSSVYFAKAKTNAIIPNPEWYDLRWRQFLPKFVGIFCKTKSAVGAFSMMSRKCKFISFTSSDRFSPLYQKNENHWLHVAGKSGQKGTDVVYETWATNPDFPHLTILQDAGKAKDRKPLDNLTLIYDHISDDELLKLQNECGVHLCPSEAEGFGHYIMEGLSAKAIVVTTDGPPMNELVDESRGVLCKWDKKHRQRFATSFYVTTDTLAEAVRKTISIGEVERNEMRER
jgi:glycosyltransferase involved in cell wall biosynthesis